MIVNFRKMHGLGNDFIIIDTRQNKLGLSPEEIRHLSGRKRGIGCDQLILIENSKNATAFMRIYNADGGEVGSCGNATRCVAALIMQENGANHITLETRAGILECSEAPDKRIAVDMGIAKLDWRDIPLARACDPNHIPLDYAGFANPSGVSMGNPHAVFFVDDAAKIDVASHGPLLERHPMFPERANISFAQILAPNKIRLRVWERGAGITEACGTAACAAAVAGFRRQLTAREATIILDGGELEISYLKDGHVIMTGPYAASFTGSFNLDNF